MEDLLEGISWLGHSGFRIKVPEATIYIDPWKPSGTEPADLILITHGHYDHFIAEDVKKVLKADTTIVTVPSVASSLEGDVRTVKPGDDLTIKGVRIEVVWAYNLRKDFHPRTADGVGFIITAGERRIYHAGDTDAIPEMDSIKSDVALLPVGGKYTMTASEAAQVANKIKPKVAIPMHWGYIIGTRSDAELFRAKCDVPTEILRAES